MSVTNSLDAEMKFFEFKKRVLQEFEEKKQGRTVAREVPVFEPWLKSSWPVLSANMKPKTARKNFATVVNHVLPFFGSLKLSEITEVTVEDFRAELQRKQYRNGKSYSPAFINDCLRQLHGILSKAAKRKLIAAVPVFPRALNEPKLMLELSADEEHAFLQAFDDREAFMRRFERPEVRGSVSEEAGAVHYASFRSTKPFFVLALHTALRRGDLLNLEWSSVDLRAGHIRLVTEKTSKPVFIPLSASAFAALQECRDRSIASTRWVFVQQNGCRLSLTTLRRHFATAKGLAGITRRFRMHDLRHTSASKMATAGVSLQVIARVLGHTSTRMSERYARPDDVAVLQIRAAMERTTPSGNLNSSLNSLPSSEK